MPLLTEADTCRKYVLPKLYAAGWTTITSASSELSPMAASSSLATARSAANRSAPTICSAIGLILPSPSSKRRPIYKKPADGLGRQRSTHKFSA